MASATYLQSLDSVYEDGTSRGITPSNRRQTETFLASAAIAANDLVALDFTTVGYSDGDKALYIRKALDSEISQVAVGFALNAATAAGDRVEVTISGIHESTNVAADTSPIIAVATEADTANVATVFVIKQF